MRRSDYTQTEIYTESLEKKESSDIFPALYRKSSSKDKVGRKQTDTFMERPLAKSLPAKDSFLSKAFQPLF